MKIKKNVDSIKLLNFNDKKILIIQGWFYDSLNLDCRMEVIINNKKIDTIINRVQRVDVLDKLKIKDHLILGYYINYELPKDEEVTSIELWSLRNDKKELLIKYGEKQIKKISKEEIIDFLELCNEEEGVATIGGWTLSSSGKKVNIRVINSKNEVVDATIKREKRKDVVENLFTSDIAEQLDLTCGFMIHFNLDKSETYFLDYYIEKGLTKRRKISFNKINYKGLIKKLSLKNVYKGCRVLIKNGPSGLKRKILFSLTNNSVDYEEYYKYHKCSQKELSEQRQRKFDYEPKISIVVPAYKTPKKFLNEMIDSVENQTYQNYELCIADGSVDSIEVQEVLMDRSKKNERIKFKILDNNYGISGNTNAALELVTGDYIALLDHDDILAESALYEVVEVINEDIENEVIYTDEDKVDMNLVHHFEPHFKPDFNLDLLRSNNYICHFFIAKREIVNQVGGFKDKYNGSQDYDFILRCTELAKNVKHLPRVLYHWRTHINSTAANPESKMYCFEAGKRAIEDSLVRAGVDGEVMFTDHLGFYRVKYKVIGEPLVSIVIPNKDHSNVLKVCIDSILAKTTYQNYEIIIVENNSTEKETFEYYSQISMNDRIKIITWTKEFNYSAINNFGVKATNGEYVILLNNDTEILTAEWIEEMLSNCQRKEVGICGAKLYYPDNTIQHAGVVVGLGGIAGHVFTNFDRDAVGYFAKCKLQQNLSAVTAACLMIQKSVFEEVNGLEEQLKVAFNDVDLCLKVRKAGYLIVFNPYVELYHYESKSRGKENTAEKVERFNSEIEYMKKNWNEILIQGDPYYNKNLTLIKSDYSLKNITE